MKNKTIKIFGIGAIVLFVLMALIPATVSAADGEEIVTIKLTKKCKKDEVGDTVQKIIDLGGKIIEISDADKYNIITITYTMEGEPVEQ